MGKVDVLQPGSALQVQIEYRNQKLALFAGREWFQNPFQHQQHEWCIHLPSLLKQEHQYVHPLQEMLATATGGC